MAAGRVFAFRDARWAPDPVLAPSPAVRSPQPVPLVIDNGSFQTRAGWAAADPSVPAEPLLRFRSLAARSRGARGGAGAETQVGNDLGSPEPLRWLLRSPFDRNVPVQLELQELLLDHVFQRLGVSSQVPPGGARGEPPVWGAAPQPAPCCPPPGSPGCFQPPGVAMRRWVCKGSGRGRWQGPFQFRCCGCVASSRPHLGVCTAEPRPGPALGHKSFA